MVFPLARPIANHPTLHIIKAFYLEGVGTAACFVRAARISQYHSLATGRIHRHQPRHNMGNISTNGLRDNPQLLNRITRQVLPQSPQAGIQTARRIRYLEDVVGDAAPTRVRLIARRNGEGLFKAPPGDPQFTVQFKRGKLLGKPSLGAAKPACPGATAAVGRPNRPARHRASRS